MTDRPIPQVADDAAAPAAVQAVYRDIRETLDTQVVNLVFRRLAAVGPEVLAQAWETMRPAHADGRIAAAAEVVLAGAALPPAPHAAPGAGLSGLAPEDLRVVRALMRTYNANNARNYAAFGALLGIGEGHEPAPLAPRPPAAQRDPEPVALPPLPALGDLDPALQAQARRLAAVVDPAPDARTVPSLFLHLAYWPAALSLAEERLAPLAADGTLAHMRAATRDAGCRAAAALSGLAAPPDLRARIRPVAGDIVERVFPGGIPVGLVLERVYAAAAA